MVRFKNRYMVVELTTKLKDSELRRKLHPDELKDLIMKTVINLHGDHGAASITGGFQLKYSSNTSSVLILRTRHGPHRLLASTLPLVQQSKHGAVRLSSLYTSGTMRQCYKFLMRHQTKNLDGLWAKLSIPDKEKLKKSLANEEKTTNKL